MMKALHLDLRGIKELHILDDFPLLQRGDEYNPDIQMRRISLIKTSPTNDSSNEDELNTIKFTTSPDQLKSSKLLQNNEVKQNCIELNTAFILKKIIPQCLDSWGEETIISQQIGLYNSNISEQLVIERTKPSGQASPGGKQRCKSGNNNYQRSRLYSPNQKWMGRSLKKGIGKLINPKYFGESQKKFDRQFNKLYETSALSLSKQQSINNELEMKEICMKCIQSDNFIKYKEEQQQISIIGIIGIVLIFLILCSCFGYIKTVYQ